MNCKAIPMDPIRGCNCSDHRHTLEDGEAEAEGTSIGQGLIHEWKVVADQFVTVVCEMTIVGISRGVSAGRILNFVAFPLLAFQLAPSPK